jgi:hypothetical protein
MRKVNFTALVKKEGSYVQIEGEGSFHSWGFETIETTESCCSTSIGIVEAEDGSVYTCYPQDIKFVNS